MADDPRELTWERLVYDYMHDLGLLAGDTDADHTACETVNKSWWTVSTVLRSVCMPWAASTCVNCWDESNWINWDFSRCANMSDVLASLRMDVPHLDRIRAAEHRGVRYVLFYVGWYWTTAPERRSAAHATLLWVDTATRQYDLFDPSENDGAQDFWTAEADHALDLARLVCSRTPAIVPGYRPYRHDVVAPPLQRVVQDGSLRAGHPCRFMAGGQCVLICLLVLLCCQRFQTGDAWDVAVAIRNVYQNWLTTPAARTSWLNHLQHLYRNLTLPWTWNRLERLIGLSVEDADGGDRRCRVFEADGTRICLLPACPGHAYCRVHRHYLMDVRTGETPDCDLPVQFPRNPLALHHSARCGGHPGDTAATQQQRRQHQRA